MLTQTSGSWVEAVSFGLIFVVLLVRPAGVFGRKEVRTDMSWSSTPTWSSSRPRITGLLLALSVQVPLRMGVFSFAGAGGYGIGAYAAARSWSSTRAGPRSPRSSSRPIVGSVVVLVLGLMIFRLNGLYLAMATVAFDLIIGVIAINGGEHHRRLDRTATA